VKAPSYNRVIPTDREINVRTILIALAWAGISFSQTVQPLFYLQRNVNANNVYYDARITAGGVIDAHDPVHVYWILWAKDTTGKTTEELSLLEKNMAYGLKIRRNRKANSFIVTLSAFPQRAITIFMENGKARAQTVIDGRVSYLEKIYSSSRETKMFPKVNYIELFGIEVKNGEPRYEKILPK